MSTIDPADGSEDVADFLARIKELGDKRQREDEERTRKLEEEILQGRKEREARRAERARSISPTKDSPLASNLSRASESPAPLSVRADSMDRDAPSFTPTRRETTPLTEPVKPNPPPSGAGLARSGTLSWQQRPGSREIPAVRSRPLSTVAAENAMRSPSATPEPSSVDTENATMSQRAQLLEGKDPAYFRQTAERGERSAAYRRNQDSQASRAENVRLPGMSREQSLDAESMPAATSTSSRARSPTHGSVSSETQSRSYAASNRSAFTSPPPLLPARGSEISIGSPASPSRSPTMSPSQGRISPDKERPASPTKGLGGFVQSAMMKRSDSVSKRVSAQPGSGLSRGDSFSRRGTNSAAEVEDTGSRSASPTKGSRGEFVKPELPDRAASVEKAEVETPGEPERPYTPVSGHARTESKRWSPTKSSWLEAAINKTEPPKPKPAASQQPSWMADLNKAKQNRGSVDLGKAKAHGEVTVGGFLRSPAPGNSSKSPAAPLSKPIVISSKPNFAEKPKEKSRELGDEGYSSGIADISTPLEKRTSTSTPSNPVKPKPETPPKKDFRSSLKSRPAPSGSGGSTEPEFKNVFGNLKPAQTKNFIAEDVLKNNILRGKAGLNVTGGPRPWQKKDEFKDSIMAKKKEMREGTSVVNTGKVNEVKEASVPEALAKKQNMASKPVVQAPPAQKAIPEALAKRQNMARPGSMTSKTSHTSVASTSSTSYDQNQPNAAYEQAIESQTEKIVDDAPLSETPKSGSQVDLSQAVKSGRGASSSSSSSSKLADRFNPGLAGILARGPPTGAAAGSPSRESAPSKPSDEPKQPSTPLTHATKSRARGPKRRAPKQGSALPEATSNVADAPKPKSTLKAPQADDTEPATTGGGEDDDAPAPKPKPYANRPMGGMTSIAASVANSAQLRSNGSNGTSSLKPAPSAPRTVTAKPKPAQASFSSPRSQNTSQPSTPELSKKPQPSKSFSVPSPKSPPQPGKKPETLTRTTSNPLSSVPSPSVPQGLGLKPGASPKPAISTSFATANDAKSPLSSQPPSPEVSRSIGLSPKPAAPPKPANKPASGASQSRTLPVDSKTNSIPQSAASPSVLRGQRSEAQQQLTNFLKQPLQLVAESKVNANTQAILERSVAPPEKIKTLKMEIWEVTGDGKKISMPTDQSHVLFEDGMFLCTHVFGSGSTGKRTTEVYLWCGAGVSSSSIEDAQLFCRNAARDAGGKLTIVEQGREPSSLFEALGGIVVTRAGPTSAAQRTSQYMLRGRRHLGHVAFDEVPFGASSLCGGFPHIIVSSAASSGSVYLWKGRGSGTDELGCARLIAMDLGVSGDIDEIDDGAEPDGFWKALGGHARQEDPERWAQKATAGERFVTRLFSIDMDATAKFSASAFMNWARRGSTPAPDEAGEHVREIAPFTQADVTAGGAASKSSSLRAALFFAQDYCVLAASVQDRPRIPAGFVVLGGAPEGMKTAFRRWRDNQSATARTPCVLGLTDALRAFEEM